MGMVQWGKEFGMNVAEIDKQHQQLIQMINDLNEAMRQGKGNAALGKILDGLINYTGTHFATEEKYFKQFAYPETGTHKQIHAEFAKKVGEFRGGFGQGQLGLSIKVMDFLAAG